MELITELLREVNFPDEIDHAALDDGSCHSSSPASAHASGGELLRRATRHPKLESWQLKQSIGDGV